MSPDIQFAQAKFSNLKVFLQEFIFATFSDLIISTDLSLCHKIWVN